MSQLAVEVEQPRRAGVNTRSKFLSLVAYVVTAGVAAGIFQAGRDSLLDDTYITLTYVRNVSEHLHWGMWPGQISNTATSVLNVLLLSAINVLVSDPVTAAGVAFVLSAVLTTWALRRVFAALGLSAGYAYAAWGLIFLNPLMFSTLGLEACLMAPLLSLLLLAAIRTRPWAFGIVAGLLILTRPDLLLFPCVLVFVSQALLRASPKIAVATLLTTGPWYLWSWIYLGSVVPDTLLIKVTANAWGDYRFHNGWLMYLDRFPLAWMLSLAPGVLAVVACAPWFAMDTDDARQRIREARPFLLLGLGGVLHVIAYSLLRVPPHHWYYCPSVIAASLAGVGIMAQNFRGDVAHATGTAYAKLAPLPLVLGAYLVYAATLGFDWIAPPIMSNWCLAKEYETIGHDLAERYPNSVIQSPGEIGRLAYFSQTRIVDLFSDRGHVVKLVEYKQSRAGALQRWLLGLNYYHLDRRIEPASPELGLFWDKKNDMPHLASWPTTSPWNGPGFIVLLEKPK